MHSTIVSTAELAAHPEWRILDCRNDLARPELGPELYRAGHIPGALHARLDGELSGPKNGSNGRHPLPEPKQFAAWLESCGVGPQDQVVAYDSAGTAYAARLWWMLQWIRHRAAAVLDGGYEKWRNEGRPISSDTPMFTRTRHPVAPNASMHVDAGYVAAHLDTPETLLLDARSSSRYAGAEEPLDPVAGHIPGAMNRPYTDNLDARGCFRTVPELRSDFAQLLGSRKPGDVLSQCGSGVTACHNILAMEIAGFGGARLYPGSWSEWCSDSSRPVARGPSPRASRT